MQNKALYATRQLAKRQYTWLRKVMELSEAATLPAEKSLIQSPMATTTATTISGGIADTQNYKLILHSFTTMEQARAYLF